MLHFQRRPLTFPVLLVLALTLCTVFVLFHLYYVGSGSYTLENITTLLPDQIVGKPYEKTVGSESHHTNVEEPGESRDIPGVDLTPGDVKIFFVEPPGRKPSWQPDIDLNMKIWKDAVTRKIQEPKDFDMDSIRPPEDPNTYFREKATIVSLVRNRELHGIAHSIKLFEEKFNSKFRYPYTFLNEQPFSQRLMDSIRELTEAEVNFVQIPSHLWRKPNEIYPEREQEGINFLKKNGVRYADQESYHNMCRFYSRNFYKVLEMDKYQYYWRIEPDVEFFSDINYDVFKYLAGTKKVYGFTVALYDSAHSVRTLFPETINFLNTGDNYKYLHSNGAFQFVTENRQNPDLNKIAGGYSTCHFWSNFEIANIDFFREDAYSKWTEHLENTGKFYYERWGDAPVHSLGLSLFTDKRKIHWFQDIGYYHAPYFNCPNNDLTAGCTVGKFDVDGVLADQNCLGNWIKFSMDEPVY